MNYDPERITLFARTDARGKNVPFGIKAKDRTRHVYVIGKTGMGKSTLLENMAVQDMRNGEGLAFIDPHGQTAETLLEYVPEERVKDVLYFAPFDMENPISFNVMEDVGPERRHLVVSGLMSVFKKIWVDAWSARMEYILTNTLLALIEYPDSTLLGVNRMLSDKDYRRAVIDNISDPAVKSFWVDEFLKYNERYMQEAGDAIKNKVGQFTANPLIRNIIGQPKSSFDMRKIMDEKKILIMNLSKGLVGESNANLLGSMLTTRIYLAAMSRADLNRAELDKQANFYFYVDEFQSFANATFADILSEARKYKLNLTIAHQYIDQMEEEVRHAVFGNVGTIISFRVGPFDAEVLETIFTPQFLAPDIVNLGFAQIYLSLMIDGIGSHPFSATTLPPLAVPTVSCKDMVIANSRQVFGHPRSVVEAAVNKWHEPIQPARKPVVENQATKSPQSNRPYEGGGNRGGNGDSGRNRSNDTVRGDSKPRSDTRPASSSYARPNPVPAREASQRPEQRMPERKQVRSTNSALAPDLQDLRAVLKKISGNSTDNQTTDKPNAAVVNAKPVYTTPKPPPANSEVKPKPKETAPNSSLRTALADVLKQPSPAAASALKPPRDDSAPRPASPLQSPKSQSPVVPKTETNPTQPPQSQAPTAPPPVVTTENPQVQPDPLSPKKLERMMRVTTSDHTPFK